MDNQQIRQIQAVSYLEGILDGEGTLTINASCGKFQPYIQITNTNPILIDYCMGQLKELGLPFHVRYGKPTKDFCKARIDITVHGLGRCKKWLEILKPRAKAKQRELILEFIGNRETARCAYPQKKPYTSEDLDIVNRIRELNHRGSVERTRYLDTNNPKVKYWENRLKLTKSFLRKGWTQTKIASYFGIDQSSLSEWIKKNKMYL